MPEISYREAVRDALSTAMREDDDVFVMGEDIAEMGGSMGVTHGMLEEFGKERVRNTPISDATRVVFFEHRTLCGIDDNVPEKIEPIPIGKACWHRVGDDVTVISPC